MPASQGDGPPPPFMPLFTDVGGVGWGGVTLGSRGMKERICKPGRLLSPDPTLLCNITPILTICTQLKLEGHTGWVRAVATYDKYLFRWAACGLVGCCSHTFSI